MLINTHSLVYSQPFTVHYVSRDTQVELAVYDLGYVWGHVTDQRKSARLIVLCHLVMWLLWYCNGALVLLFSRLIDSSSWLFDSRFTTSQLVGAMHVLNLRTSQPIPAADEWKKDTRRSDTHDKRGVWHRDERQHPCLLHSQRRWNVLGYGANATLTLPDTTYTSIITTKFWSRSIAALRRSLYQFTSLTKWLHSVKMHF